MSPPSTQRTPSPTKPNTIKSFLKNLTISRKQKPPREPPKPPPKVTQYRLSSRPVDVQELAAAPNLGDDGWGDKSWQRVKPSRERQGNDRILAWREASRLEGEGGEEGGSHVGMLTQKLQAQMRSTSTRTLSSFGGSTSLSSSPAQTAQTAQVQIQALATSPRKTTSASKFTPPHTTSETTLQTTPSHLTHRVRSTPSRRTHSVGSAASSSRTHTTPIHKTPSGSSYNAQGVNVRAIPTRSAASGGGAAYTKQGVRVGSDGYVGKWKDPRKGEKEGGTGVWKGHPALQPRPGGAGGEGR